MKKPIFLISTAGKSKEQLEKEVRCAFNNYKKAKSSPKQKGEQPNFKSMAKSVEYYDYDENDVIKCPACSWSGKAKNGEREYYNDLFDVSCPKCNQMILIVPHPLVEDVKKAYDEGNPKAQDDILTVRLIEKTRRESKEIISKAVDFAYKTHQIDQFQTRKGKYIPYILHPLSVANRLSRVDAGPEIIAAGTLHDTIEDSVEENKVTKEILEQEFGTDIARMVDDVTEQDRSLPWAKRKAAALSHIPNMEQDSLLVKSADVLDNLSDQLEDYKIKGDEMWENYNAKKDKQLVRYNKVVESLEKAWSENPLLPALKEELIFANKHWK